MICNAENPEEPKIITENKCSDYTGECIKFNTEGVALFLIGSSEIKISKFDKNSKSFENIHSLIRTKSTEKEILESVPRRPNPVRGARVEKDPEENEKITDWTLLGNNLIILTLSTGALVTHEYSFNKNSSSFNSKLSHKIMLKLDEKSYEIPYKIRIHDDMIAVYTISDLGKESMSLRLFNFQRKNEKILIEEKNTFDLTKVQIGRPKLRISVAGNLLSGDAVNFTGITKNGYCLFCIGTFEKKTCFVTLAIKKKISKLKKLILVVLKLMFKTQRIYYLLMIVCFWLGVMGVF